MPMPIDKFGERFVGYSLLDRIGAGGYGEVWKAEAPGGLAKAVKFVYGFLAEERASRELKALQRIKEVRHPFLLSLECIEIIDGRLVIITELADGSLKERYQQCRNAGLPGIPRNELLHYLRDTSEALDYMSQQFSLQHLDIKPENLLILGGRIKVADFGLVKEIENVTVSIVGGMTPVYAAPELFDGGPSRYSDQYSLAIVYQEMLSGFLPYPGKTTTQLAKQHLQSQPQLSPLPPADRPIIARALSTDPRRRFPNCLELIESLFAVESSSQVDKAAPQCKKLQGQEHCTTYVTQMCDTKSPHSQVAFDENDLAVPAGSSSIEGAAAYPASFEKISSTSFPSSLNEVFNEADHPSHSSAEADLSASSDDWLEIEGEAACCALPPLEIVTAGSLHPVLVIGAGGAAGRVLGKLQERICEHWKNNLPSFRMLLLDTDPQALGSGPSDETFDLPAGSKISLSLRRLEKYHAVMPQLLRWLDRRWLYNIPRSGRPNGLRPLGRLAFVDHAEDILLRIRATIEQLLAPESLDITAQLTGLPIGCTDPQIYLVSSLGGGTGSGMIFDLAYAVRKVLAETGLKAARLCGILTFSTPRQPDEKKLALANAHAALRELRYYASFYPGEPSCGLEPSHQAGGPFDEVYCVDWGDDLDEGRFDEEGERLADYLFANTLAPQRTFFEACRAKSAPSDSAPELAALATVNTIQREAEAAMAAPQASNSCARAKTACLA